MINLKKTPDLEIRLTHLTLMVKEAKSAGMALNSLPENIWIEALALAKLTSVQKVVLSTGVSKYSLYKKINEQKLQNRIQNDKNKKSKSAFLEITPLVENNKSKPFSESFNNFKLKQQMTPDFNSSGMQLYVDFIRPDGIVMQVHGSGAQINLPLLISQFLGGVL